MQDNFYNEVNGTVTALLLQVLKEAILNYWYLWLVISLIVTIRFGLSIFKVYKINKAGLPEIDKMSGTEFEIYLERLFNRLGYKVDRVGKMPDYGADLLIEKDGIKTAVQAKCWHSPVTVKAIQEINTAKAHYSASEAMVVTNSRFTSNARTLAKENNVELIDRKKLAALILQKS